MVQITPKIMFYFKLTPIPIDEIDADSIKKINEFKKELGQKGVLYWEYKSFEEFQKLIRIQLPRQIIEFVKTINPLLTADLSIKKTDMVDGDEELGLLDFVELGVANFSDVTDIVNRMTSAIEWMSKRFIEKTDELNIHLKIKNPLSVSLQKHIIDSSAEDMNSFVSRLKVEIPLFAEAYRKGLDNFSAG